MVLFGWMVRLYLSVCMWMCALKHNNFFLVHFNKCMRQSFETILTACDFSTFLAFELFSTIFFHSLYFFLFRFRSMYLSFSSSSSSLLHTRTWYCNQLTVKYKCEHEHTEREPLCLEGRKTFQTRILSEIDRERRGRGRDEKDLVEDGKFAQHTVIPTLIFLLLSSSFLFILMFQQ